MSNNKTSQLVGCRLGDHEWQSTSFLPFSLPIPSHQFWVPRMLLCFMNPHIVFSSSLKCEWNFLRASIWRTRVFWYNHPWPYWFDALRKRSIMLMPIKLLFSPGIDDITWLLLDFLILIVEGRDGGFQYWPLCPCVVSIFGGTYLLVVTLNQIIGICLSHVV